MSKKVMICAGEASGDLYGALLSRELKTRWPGIEIFGIGGEKMQAEGVSIITPITHILGLAEVVRHLFAIREAFRKAREALYAKKPDILILIDYPDFNIALAKRAKRAGIPILYYVSPQVWAWRSRRIKKISSLINKMAVLFPFEVKYYSSSGLDCEFVGHPITETLPLDTSREEIRSQLGLEPHRRVVSLLPGSRPNEIEKHQSIIIALSEKIHAEFPDVQIIVPLVPGTALTERVPDFIRIIYNQTAKAVACSDASAVASGTATLEAALVGTPMVVFYRISPLTFFLGKLLTKVSHISLVNILSEKQVVKELLQEEANADTLFHELNKIISDTSYRNTMTEHLNKIRNIMKEKRPSSRVAEITGEITGWNTHAAPL